MYSNGVEQGPMYAQQGNLSYSGSQQSGLVATKTSAANLLAQQIEHTSMQTAEILKISAEIRERLLGPVPENAQAVPQPAYGGGVFASASTRLHTIEQGLEEAKRLLSAVLSEV